MAEEEKKKIPWSSIAALLRYAIVASAAAGSAIVGNNEYRKQHDMSGPDYYEQKSIDQLDVRTTQNEKDIRYLTKSVDKKFDDIMNKLEDFDKRIPRRSSRYGHKGWDGLDWNNKEGG